MNLSACGPHITRLLDDTTKVDAEYLEVIATRGRVCWPSKDGRYSQNRRLP